VDDRHEIDLGMLVEVALDLGGIDGVVVRHLELVQLGPEVLQPVAHPLAEHAGDEVQHGGAGLHEPTSRRLEPEDRLALHEQDVVLGEEDLGELPLGVSEQLHEGRVVVVGDLLGLGSQNPGPRHRRPGGEREVGIAHDGVSFH
jgi:hypothetical protein